MAYDEFLADRIRHKFKELNISFEDKKMMGGICFLVNGKMCAGVVKEKLQHKNFFFNILQHPSHYHVHILPDAFKKQTTKKLTRFIERHNKKYNTDISYLFTHILHELDQPHDAEALKKFHSVTKQVDDLRNENIFEVIPELQVLQ